MKIEIYTKQCRSAFSTCCGCCPCSAPLLFGLILGVLVTGTALAVIISMYVVDAKKTTAGSNQGVTGTTTTATTATTGTTTSATTTTATTSTSVTTATSTTSATTTTTSTTSTQTTTTTTSATTTTTTSVTTTTTSSMTTVTTTTATTTTTTAPYCTTLVTFDDIPSQSGSTGVVPNGYYNLNWTNVNYINGSSMPLSGFQYGIQSPPYVAYRPNGTALKIASANGTRFSFDSVVITSAWRDSLIWTLTGSRSGSNFVIGSLLLQVLNRTTITCGGCSNYDAVYFESSGGTPRSGLAQNGTEFAIDNLCISFGY